MGSLRKILGVFLALALLSVFFCTPSAKSAEDDLRFGINYYGVNHHYEQYRLTDDILDRDFSLFQSQGLKFIILEAVWAYIGRTEDSYAPEAIPDLIRVCSFAEKYNLKVVIDFHTLMGSKSWTMPWWLTNRNFETVLLNDTAKQHWLDFLGYIAKGFNDVPNLEGWQMMNEPGWSSTLPADQFVNKWVDLWKQMKEVFKSYSDRPVSIRFDEALIRPDYFKMNPQICDVCDFLSFNWFYRDDVNELARVKQFALDHEKKVMISEFGTDTGDTGTHADDTTVTAQYLASIEYFRSYGVEDCAAFYWQADFISPNNSPFPPGTDYNLALDILGTPRPAFYCLKNEPEPTVTPYPTPKSTPTPKVSPTHSASSGTPAPPTITPAPTLTETPTPTSASSPTPEYLYPATISLGALLASIITITLFHKKRKL